MVDRKTVITFSCNVTDFILFFHACCTICFYCFFLFIMYSCPIDSYLKMKIFPIVNPAGRCILLTADADGDHLRDQVKCSLIWRILFRCGNADSHRRFCRLFRDQFLRFCSLHQKTAAESNRFSVHQKLLFFVIFLILLIDL